jgi:predicted nicotinamide N-methyase
VTGWLRRQAARGGHVLLADPGRTYRPRDFLHEAARYTVPTSLELEDRETRETIVWQVLPGCDRSTAVIGPPELRARRPSG